MDAAQLLGLVLYELGKKESASDLQEQVLDRCRVLDGDGSFSSLVALRNLAVTDIARRENLRLRDVGRDVVIALVDRGLGVDPVDPQRYVESLYSLAYSWRVIGEAPLASKLYKRVITGCVRTRHGLGMLLKSLGAEIFLIPPGLLARRLDPNAVKAVQEERNRRSRGANEGS